MRSRGKEDKRYSGVLCAISSLPSDFGIGSFGKAAYDFVDFLSDAKQRFWQILPLNPLGEGNSPYKSPSAFAGEILYIDIDFLLHDKLLLPQEINQFDFSKNIEYDSVKQIKIPLLVKASERVNTKSKNYLKFLDENNFWLNDFAIFMAAVQVYKCKKITELPQGILYKIPCDIEKFVKENNRFIEFYKITQYIFFCQYYALKRYANSKGIKIIGDIPFYVSPDSADVWSEPDQFILNRDYTPKLVAGVPPDVYSQKGQLWGNPIYDWKYMRQDKYSWWQRRLLFCKDMYDVTRIDHFRAFASFYKIPYGCSASQGEWSKGEGSEFWDAIKQNISDINIIAEDLGGEEDEAVIELLKHTDFANMKILQFAFNGKNDNIYLPQNYPYNCVCYTGTHDNNTAIGWYNSADRKERVIFNTLVRNNADSVAHDMIRALSKSNSMLCIIPMQDLLSLDSGCRMNTPGTTEKNWQWRMKKEDINCENAKLLKELTKERNG